MWKGKHIIHVNQHFIRANTKHKTDKPVLTIKGYKTPVKNAHETIIRDKNGEEIGRIVYRPHKPLSCGARVWIEFLDDKVDIELVEREWEDDKN